MSLKDDLIAAKALIDTPEKWIKGSFCVNGCRCALGAIFTVSAIDGEWSEAKEHQLIEAVSDSLPEPWKANLISFNDHPDTSHADIMALFDRAINAADMNAKPQVKP